MARPKGSKNKTETIATTVTETPTVCVEVVPTSITYLSVDYPSEGLNNMARKINELIERFNSNG